jgi:hypothetical protein
MPSLTIWTRLEPRCRDADLTTALQARTHDPLWFLARQWQLGEALGDDACSPILAAVTTTESVLNRVAAGTTGATVLPRGTPLEAFIEREAVRPSTPDIEYRQSADAGLYFLRLLREGNVGELAPLYVTHYGIAPPTAAQQASLDPPALAVAAIVSNRVPDGARLAADLRAAQPGLRANCGQRLPRLVRLALRRADDRALNVVGRRSHGIPVLCRRQRHRYTMRVRRRPLHGRALGLALFRPLRHPSRRRQLAAGSRHPRPYPGTRQLQGHAGPTLLATLTRLRGLAGF